MARHNYIRDLRRRLQTLPGSVIRDEPWPFCPNPINKASLIIFEKQGRKPAASTFDFVSPITKNPLIASDGFLFCAAEGMLYPQPFGIPQEPVIVTQHYQTEITSYVVAGQT